MGLEAPDLARWTRFAAKGGIGKCTATCDCVAENADDLMFLKDDEITVLLQLPDKENLFLGYCEGVVGHFSGSDVHFHAKLKKPIKAKRASTASGKSPSPSDINLPIGQPSSRRSSTSKMEGEALERRISQRVQAQIPCRVQPVEDEQQQYLPSMTFSSSSTGTDSVVTTPALGYFSSPEIKKSSMYGTPSPRDAHFSTEVLRSKSMPPTRASSPPTLSVSHSHAAITQTVHKHNIHMPPPLQPMPESTTPLRINKRTPASSPSGPQFSHNSSQSMSPSPLQSSLPDTSHSTYGEWSKRHSIGMSDAEVGIGLSLLQDLANGMDSDSDDGDDQWSKPDQYDPATDTLDPDSYAAALDRVGHRKDSLDEGTQESTVEGLCYARSEEDCDERELAGTGRHAVIVEDMPSQTTSAVTTRRPSPNLSIHSNSNANASHNPNTFLPSSTSPISPSFSHDSSSVNGRRPSLAPSAASTSEWEGASDIYDDYRYSRYSVASKMSRFSSSAGIGGWTGSGGPLTPPLPDPNSIGRARTDSNKSRPDSSSVFARSRADSVNTRAHVDLLSNSSEMKAAVGGSIGGGQEPQESQKQDQPRNLHLKRMTIMKERATSMESAASVYTQNSRLSTLSQDTTAIMSFGSDTNNHFLTSSTSSNINGKNSRPTPLSLSPSAAKSPLLHTTWSTPLSDGASTRSSAASGSSDLHTPLLGIVAVGEGARAGDAVPLGFTEEGRINGSSDMTAGSFGHGGNGVGIASALRQKVETDRWSPMSEQTQDQRLIRNSSDVNSFIQKDGLGHRIVVEDEDELPSRILDTSGSTFMSMITTASPEPIHDEDEEENYINEQDRSRSAGANTGAGNRGSLSSPDSDLMMLRTHLAPLTVMNKTPSLSVLESASDGGRRAGEAEEKQEQEQEEQEREQEGRIRKEVSSPIVPTVLLLNASTPTPPPPQLSVSSSPHVAMVMPPPRLSSASGPIIRATTSPTGLRPPLALSDIREPGGPLVPGSNQRRSLFLPHPNAPKAPGGTGSITVTGLVGPGPGVPMYIASQQQQQPQDQQQQQQQGQQAGWAKGPESPPQIMMPPVRPNVIGVIRMALTVPPRVTMVKGQGPPGQGPAGQRSPLMIPMRGPTIYGRTETDLASSMGPVPILFSIDPPHVTAPRHTSFSNSVPTSLAPPPQGTPTSKPTMSSSPPRAPIKMMTKLQPQPEPQQLQNASLGLAGAGAGAVAVGASVGNIGPGAGDGDMTPAIESKTVGGVVPRANFLPKQAGMRPRSRSFSGFNSMTAENPLPLQQSRHEGEIPSGRDVKRSLTTSASSPSPSSSLPPPPPPGTSKILPRLSPLRLFPLNNVTDAVIRHGSGVQPALKSPTSPLVQTMFPSGPSVASSLPASPNNFSMGMGSRPQYQLRETASIPTSTETLPAPSRPIPIPRLTTPGPATETIDSPLSPSQTHGRTTTDTSSHVSDSDNVSIHSDTRSQLASPSVARQSSLRTKLSLPNLRRNRSRQEDEFGGVDSEMLQVQDMEFELVKPSFAHLQSAKASEDSGVLGKDHSSMDIRQDGNAFLRTESPAISMSSSTSKRSPSMVEPSSSSRGPLSISNPASRATTDSESSMDAHRNRETKWMSLMSSSPASQARKSKKVRKLIMDGVPSSVRYLVWSYLTDGKARCVPGVYAQLCSRGRVPSSSDIEQDINNSFQDQPHLQGTQGPVLLLLQAYLNMVPDIQYTMGLTLIVGQLLLLAPEEDAFWIFISIMDTHIRPYFSASTTQMEVDSALFSRALESNDNQVARKLLVDMGISPSTICQPWFSSLFVGTLPPEYLNRIWDLFLFEGIPFLLRVALTIVACCRRVILECTSEEMVLQIFRHPQQSFLPPSPDAFLSVVCSIKLKDDDVRKQRVRMEAQVKRQTQVPRTVSSTGGISLPRTS